ncbi:MAG: ChaN family lipoprotein [Bdellovibrionales bacterium]|nr:ChaN family lipoprotein [Bdellovibrionales bacterium]
MAQTFPFQFWFFLLGALLLSSCQHQVGNPELSGKIWDVHRQQFLSEEVFYATLRQYDYILLGETHDNAAHHQHQAEIIKQLKPPTVVLEHLNAEQARLANASPVAELEKQLHWGKSGWPDYSLFEPVFVALKQTKGTLVAGAIDADTLKQVRAGKQGPLSAKTLRRFGALEKRSKWDTELSKILEYSHCGQLPQIALAEMVEVQKYKDLFMAYQMGSQEKALLLAGAGHTRDDNGVPFYLHKAFPKKKIATVQFTEVENPSAKAEDYSHKPADFLWFTSHPDRPDPCAAFHRPKVVIDPGHSPESPGVRSTTGKDEVLYNDAFSEKLKNLLQSRRVFEAALSREPDENLSLRERVDRIRALKPQVVLSIHHDSMQEVYLEKRANGGWVTREPAGGFSLFVSTVGAQADRSRTLAELIGHEFVALGRKPTLHHAEKIEGENRKLLEPTLGIYEYNELAVLKNATAPTVLVELGLIVDEDDEEYLSSPATQARIAGAIQAALEKFLK